MVARKKGGAEQFAQDAKDLAEDVRGNAWIDRMTRLGYAVRGIIYGLIGFLAARLALTGSGQITDQAGVLSAIAMRPFGRVLLMVIAVGLLGMLIWGIIRAVTDPYRKGNDLKGLASRAGYMISGLSYGALLLPTLRMLTGAGQSSGSSSEQAQQTTAGILTQPWGPWLVGAVGLALMGVGVGRIILGVRGKLTERLKAYAMSSDQRRLARHAGRAGYIAHGLSLGLTGFLALLAATSLDAEKVGGLDQALRFLLEQPYGPWLLGLMAVGLIAYALYSFMGALWFRIKEL
jgi:hypothetical protein